MARKSRYEARIEDYVDAVRERDSYKPRPGEEQTEARQSKLKIAEQRVKLCYSVLRGQDLGEAKRRLLPATMGVTGLVIMEKTIGDTSAR